MTTPLIDVVTSRTALTDDGRQVEISLVPGSIDTATPESIRFHLVGLYEKSDRTIPLPMLLRLAGYDVKLPKLAKGQERLSAADEIKKLWEQPELQELERRVKAARESEELL